MQNAEKEKKKQSWKDMLYLAACFDPKTSKWFSVDVQVTHASCTNVPVMAFEQRVDNNSDSPSPLQPGGHSVHSFQTEYQMVTFQIKWQFFRFNPDNVKMNSGPEKRATFVDVVPVQFPLCMFNFHLSWVRSWMLCSQTVVFGSVPVKWYPLQNHICVLYSTVWGV